MIDLPLNEYRHEDYSRHGRGLKVNEAVGTSTSSAMSRILISCLLLAASAVGSVSLYAQHENHDATHHIRSSRLLQDALDGEQCSLECCQASFEEDELCEIEGSWVDALPFALSMVLIFFLLCMSALFSGLTLGLMSLDKTGLQIVMSGDDARNADFAKTIYPIREDGNLLLCTLLLGNVAVNSMLSILMAEYAGGIAGFLVSTFSIVIFGEIVPQALCSRYALRIGSATIPLVKIIRAMFYPIAKPLAWCLDKALGRELASTYSTTEMLKLLQIHVQENIIDKETAGAMTGALTYKNITVKEVMSPLARTFMLNVDEKLSFETIAKIFKTGYSRIPVYEISPNNIIGLLFVKDLIFVDPEDATPLRSFIQIFGRGVHVVWPDDTLGDVLNELKRGRSHLALVRDVNNEDETKDPFYEMRGIITLEDIIEKILGDTIVDETDAFVDSQHRVKVDRAESFEWARLRLLDTKITDEHLSHHEVKAVVAHLRMNYTQSVDLLTDSQLTRLIAETPVSNLPTADHQLGNALPSDLLYEKGVPNQACTLVLGGRVSVLVGTDNFRSDVSSWSMLAISALSDPSYAPDFTAFVSDGPCRCLQITHQAFAHAVDASTVERNDGSTLPGVITPNASADITQTPSEDAPPVPVNRRQQFMQAFVSSREVEKKEFDIPNTEVAKKPVGFQVGGVFQPGGPADTKQKSAKNMKTPAVSFAEGTTSAAVDSTASDSTPSTPDAEEKDHKKVPDKDEEIE